MKSRPAANGTDNTNDNLHALMVTTTPAIRAEVRQRVIEVRQLMDVELDPSSDVYLKMRSLLDFVDEAFAPPDPPGVAPPLVPLP